MTLFQITWRDKRNAAVAAVKTKAKSSKSKTHKRSGSRSTSTFRSTFTSSPAQDSGYSSSTTSNVSAKSHWSAVRNSGSSSSVGSNHNVLSHDPHNARRGGRSYPNDLTSSRINGSSAPSRHLAPYTQTSTSYPLSGHYHHHHCRDAMRAAAAMPPTVSDHAAVSVATVTTTSSPTSRIKAALLRLLPRKKREHLHHSTSPHPHPTPFATSFNLSSCATDPNTMATAAASLTSVYSMQLFCPSSGSLSAPVSAATAVMDRTAPACFPGTRPVDLVTKHQQLLQLQQTSKRPCASSTRPTIVANNTISCVASSAPPMHPVSLAQILHQGVTVIKASVAPMGTVTPCTPLTPCTATTTTTAQATTHAVAATLPSRKNRRLIPHHHHDHLMGSSSCANGHGTVCSVTSGSEYHQNQANAPPSGFTSAFMIRRSSMDSLAQTSAYCPPSPMSLGSAYSYHPQTVSSSWTTSTHQDPLYCRYQSSIGGRSMEEMEVLAAANGRVIQQSKSVPSFCLSPFRKKKKSQYNSNNTDNKASTTTAMSCSSISTSPTSSRCGSTQSFCSSSSSSSFSSSLTAASFTHPNRNTSMKKTRHVLGQGYDISTMFYIGELSRPTNMTTMIEQPIAS